MLFLKESTYILNVEDDISHFFIPLFFIFANNAKIHDRLLYWAPLTYKTKNKHTLHSMIHTNTFFLKSGWGVTSLEFIFSRFCFGFVIGCNISLEILGSKGFNFFIIISGLTWKVKFCIIKNQSISYIEQIFCKQCWLSEKVGLISKSFSLWLKSPKKRCQITILRALSA